MPAGVLEVHPSVANIEGQPATAIRDEYPTGLLPHAVEADVVAVERLLTGTVQQRHLEPRPCRERLEAVQEDAERQVGAAVSRKPRAEVEVLEPVVADREEPI